MPISSLSPSMIGDASPLATTTATNQQEEYERAVSFLREFHSRQATQLSSPTSHHLDAILETTPDGRSFEDVLSLDFTLALSMGSKGSDSSSSLSSSSHSAASFSSPNQPSSMVSSSTSSSSSPNYNRSSKRMKKTHTCACLQDLISDEAFTRADVITLQVSYYDFYQSELLINLFFAYQLICHRRSPIKKLKKLNF